MELLGYGHHFLSSRTAIGTTVRRYGMKNHKLPCKQSPKLGALLLSPVACRCADRYLLRHPKSSNDAARTHLASTSALETANIEQESAHGGAGCGTCWVNLLSFLSLIFQR